MQTKLAISQPGDAFEQEADRIADQVLASPADSRVSAAPPHIQRFTGQSTGKIATAPASVDRVLASSGRPLDSALQQDMEQRFGHDFSQVRVHSGAAAEQSTQDVSAHAYTVGHNIVFGASQFAPATHEGLRLIAHELTHVVQQSGEQIQPMLQRKEENNTALAEIQGLAMYELLPRLTKLPINVLLDEEAGEHVGGPRLIIAMRAAKAKIDHGIVEFLANNKSEIEALSGGARKSQKGRASHAPPPAGDQFDQAVNILSFLAEPAAASAPGPTVTPAPAPTQNTSVPGPIPVSKMSNTAKLLRAYELSDIKKAEREQLGRIITPEAMIAALGSFLIGLVVAEFTPVGWVATIGIVLTAAFVGKALSDAINHLKGFAAAVDATTDLELKQAGHEFSLAIAGLEIDVLIFLLTHKAGGGGKGAGPTGPPPATQFEFAEVLGANGVVIERIAAVKIATTTPRISVLQAAQLGLKGGGLANAKGGLRSDDTANGDKPSGKPDLIDAKRTENLRLKESLGAQAKVASDHHSAIIEEIQANTSRINELRKAEPRPANAGEQIRELQAKNRGLALEGEGAQTTLEQLDRKIGQSQLTVYEKLTTSSKGKVSKESARARKIDLPSEQPQPSEQLAGDHLYSLRKLAAHPDFAKLTFDQQNALAHHSRNVVPMNGIANSSKGQLSWAEWGGWEKYYNIVARNKMLKIEVEVQGATRAEIARLLAEGPSGVARP